MSHTNRPRTQRIRHNTPSFTFDYIINRESLKEGSPGYAVVKRGGSFHAVPSESYEMYHGEVEIIVYGLGDSYPGVLYGPVYPSLTIEDVEGATYAYDDGTYWHFAHCSPEEQLAFAAEAEAFTVGEFALAIANAQLKVSEATNDVAKGKAVGKLRALISFAAEAGGVAYNTVTEATLGHYHRNPHNDHLRDLAVESIKAILAKWTKAGLTDQTAALNKSYVNASVTAIVTKLNRTRTIEWRAARVKRLAAEAAAAETETETTETSGG